jgi:hypothetical protein
MVSGISSVQRVTNRAKREVVARVAPLNRLVQAAHETRVRAHAPHLPPLAPHESELLDELRSEGVAKTSLDALGLANIDSVKRALEKLVSTLGQTDAGADSSIKPTPEDLLEDRSLWQCGLDPRLLAMAENYIGLPVRYYGAAVFRSIADGKTVGTRQWHRDIEDHRMMKMLVWLNDVSPSGGALEYIPKRRSQEAVERLHYVSGYVKDDDIREVVPPADWRKATGPRWTAVLADPAHILHRGSPAEDQDRYSVTFTWTSRHPVKTMPSAEQFSSTDLSRIREGLDEDQLACLPRALQST